MLPAIYFIFSRAACDDAVTQCLREGLRLDHRRGAPPDPGHRRRPRRGPDRRGPPPPRLRRRGSPGSRPASPPTTPAWCPPFKEAVEACFAAGLGQGGVRHRDPLARHQHAGPVGGDREADQVHRGTPRVPDRRGVHPARPAGPGGAASTTSATPSCSGRRSSPSTRWPAWPGTARFALTSSFRPTYNMAANLVRRYPPDRGPPPPQPVVRPVPGRQRHRPPRDPAGPQPDGPRRGRGRRRRATAVTPRSTGGCCGPARSRPASGRR